MKYLITMSIEAEAQSDQEAHLYAHKLGQLLKSPMVSMAVQGEGIRLVGDGHPVVYAPLREAQADVDR